MKKTEEFKSLVEKTRNAKCDLIKLENDSIVHIYKSTPKIITKEDVENEKKDISKIKRKSYSIELFDEDAPKSEDFYEEAYNFALENVKTFKFWKKRELISYKTEEKMKELHQNAMENWNKRRNEFFAHQNSIKEKKEKEYELEFQKEKEAREKIFDKILNPDEEYLIETVSDVLSQVELPVDFSIDYSVSGKTIELDIDLPEIEDFPQMTATILQSGKLSMKKKLVTDLNKDYATSVTGMAFYIAGLLFNISPIIENIIVSGYTQRLNKKTGNIENQYVYNVNFTRKKFSELNIENIDPIQAITNFENEINCSSKFELKTIEVRTSENRKSDAENQQIQTEYYRVEPEKKTNTSYVLDSKLSNENSSLIQQS